MNMVSADGYRSEDDVHLGIIHEDEISPGEFRRVIRDSAVAHSARKKQTAQRASAKEIIAFADPPEDDDWDCCTDLQSLDGFEEVHSAFEILSNIKCLYSKFNLCRKHAAKPLWVQQLSPSLGIIGTRVIKYMKKKKYIVLQEDALAINKRESDLQMMQFAVLDSTDIDSSCQGLKSLRNFISTEYREGYLLYSHSLKY